MINCSSRMEQTQLLHDTIYTMLPRIWIMSWWIPKSGAFQIKKELCRPELLHRRPLSRRKRDESWGHAAWCVKLWQIFWVSCSVKEAGVQAPLGFWDPLGLSTSGNVSDYKRRREVELKHGILNAESATSFLWLSKRLMQKIYEQITKHTRLASNSFNCMIFSFDVARAFLHCRSAWKMTHTNDTTLTQLVRVEKDLVLWKDYLVFRFNRLFFVCLDLSWPSASSVLYVFTLLYQGALVLHLVLPKRQYWSYWGSCWFILFRHLE